MRCAPGGQDQSKLLGLCNGREPPYLYVQTRPALGAAQRLEPAEETRKRQSDPRNGTTDRLALQSRRDVPEPARGRANASRASDAQPRDCCGGISAAAIGNIRRGTGHHGPSNGLRPESFRLALEIVRLFATQAAPQVLTFPARLQLFSCDSCVFAVHIWARGPIPWQACFGSRPFRVGTRHVPAAMHPRPFAGGDSHRSQGFLYPWKPYAPPHIPVYCRFVPPPAAAEQTGKPVGTPAMLLPPAAAKASRECVGECGAAMGPGVKKPQATVLIAYGEWARISGHWCAACGSRNRTVTSDFWIGGERNE